MSLSGYDSSWAESGRRERSTLGVLLGVFAVEVQHVGSTAVEGLDAKPILDIAVGLAPVGGLDVAEIGRRMGECGYEYRGDHGADEGLLFVRGAGVVRIVHVHMVPFGDPQWTDYIRFRDYLRVNPGRRRDYQMLKRDLVTHYADDRGAYTSGKAAFVVETLHLAGAQDPRPGRIHDS